MCSGAVAGCGWSLARGNFLSVLIWSKKCFSFSVLALTLSSLFTDFSPSDRVKLFNLLSLYITDPSSTHHVWSSLLPSVFFPNGCHYFDATQKLSPQGWWGRRNKSHAQQSWDFKRPGGMYIGSMKTGFGECLLKQWNAYGSLMLWGS